jgi:hypothetical protein
MSRDIPPDPPLSEQVCLKTPRIGYLDDQQSPGFQDSVSLLQRLHGMVQMLEGMVEQDHVEESVLIALLGKLALEYLYSVPPSIFGGHRTDFHPIGLPALRSQSPEHMAGTTPDVQNPSLAPKWNHADCSELDLPVDRIEREPPKNPAEHRAGHF